MTPDKLRTALAAMPGPILFALFAVLGGLAAFGLPPQSMWYCTLLALAAVFAMMSFARSARQAGWWLWCFGTAYFAVGLRWLVEPFQVEADIFGWMAPFALAFMAGGLALFWAAAGWAAVRLSRMASVRPLTLVLTLSGAELARAYVLTGFPWAGFAQIWVDTPVALGLRIIGPHGLGVLTLLLAASPAVMAVDWRMRVGRSMAIAAVLVGILPYDFAKPSPRDTSGPVIRIVQPNAPQHEKWHPEKAGTFFWRQIDASSVEPRPDLIVWPETAIPQLYNNAEETLKVVADAAAGVPVILGMQRYDEGGYYNALLVMDADGQVTDIYDKHHLVPFGEYMPLASVVGQLGIVGLAQQAAGGYSSGPGPRVLDLGPELGRALPLICYEAVFPQHASSKDGRPDFLIQITNDAWFGTYAGPQQHLAQARMRAIEQGLPMVRSANTGISAMIDSQGQIIDSLPMGTHGFVDVALPIARKSTVYAHTGDWPVALLLFAGLSLLIKRAFTKIND